MAEIRIVPMKDDEVQLGAELFNEFLFDLKDLAEDPYFDFNSLDIPSRIDKLKLNKEKYNGCVYFAKVDGEAVGLISCLVIPCFLAVSSVNEVGYIEGAYVREGFRGKGLMRLLEAEVRKHFKALGLAYLELCIISKNRMARSCWEHLGYETFREQMRKSL